MTNTSSSPTVQIRGLLPKIVAGGFLAFVAPGGILLLGSGRLDWWEGWAMIVLLGVTTLVSRGILILRHPDLALERIRFTEAEGAKTWDTRLMPVMAIFGPMLIWLVAGLDRRWSASAALSPGVEIAAFVCVALTYAFSAWAMVANRFFSAVVRIQRERGHSVIRSGPYRIVRHPGYAGAMLGFLFTPVALGSMWALIPAVLTALVVVARTALEDATLQAELPGYRDYSRETRYRLLPGIW